MIDCIFVLENKNGDYFQSMIHYGVGQIDSHERRAHLPPPFPILVKVPINNLCFIFQSI